MLQAIDELHRLPAEKHYAKMLPVAQSSGTGKSKTIDMIGTKRITFPFCLREDLGEDYFGTYDRLYGSGTVADIGSFGSSVPSHRQSSSRLFPGGT